MGNSEFRFRKFTVRQECCAMKVGTDGVLLGAWCRITTDQKRLLDVGTGSGLIALMTAQRSEGFAEAPRIDAVEIESSAAVQAAANFAASPWAGRLFAYHTPVQDFASGRCGLFDHIVSNPPYFSESLQSPTPARSIARHTGSLSHAELLQAVGALLAPGGIFSVIVPASDALYMNMEAARQGLCLQRRTWVMTKPDTPPKRVLAEYGRTVADDIVEEDVTIHAAQGAYSIEYRMLTQDFYL